MYVVFPFLEEEQKGIDTIWYKLRVESSESKSLPVTFKPVSRYIYIAIYSISCYPHYQRIPESLPTRLLLSSTYSLHALQASIKVI